MDTKRLADVVGRVAQSVSRYRGKALTEQDTKNAFVEPVLDALGWPKDDLERVRAEYRHTSKYNPVDYALFAGRKPVVFVEAKALDRSIEEHKFVSQVLAYAAVAGVSWALLTNGEQWDLFAVFARVDAPRKRFFSIRITDPDFVEWIAWVSPSRLDGNELERLWRLLFAEGAVKDTALTLFRERDDDLVALLSRKTSLPTTEVVMALEALELSLRSATMEGRIQILARKVGETPPGPAVPTPVVKEVRIRKVRRAASKSVLRGAAPALPGAGIHPPGASIPLTELPPTGRKPTWLRVGGKSWAVTNWKDLLLVAVDLVHAAHPSRYDGLFDDETFHGRKRPYFARTPGPLREAVSIPDGFAEGNISAETVVRLTGRVLAFFGYDVTDAFYAMAGEA